MASELEPASPEIKRYQRQKIAVAFAGTILGLTALAILGFRFGPALGDGESRARSANAQSVGHPDERH